MTISHKECERSEKGLEHERCEKSEKHGKSRDKYESLDIKIIGSIVKELFTSPDGNS